MRRFTSRMGTVAFSGFLIVAVLALASPDEQKRRITVDEIEDAVVIGRFGVPLGNVVTIVGRWDYAGKGYERFTIREVDGQIVKPPVEFAVDRPRRLGVTASGADTKFELGRDYRLRVFETATFDGFRSEWYDETGEGIPQSHSYGFRSRVVVLRGITKSGKSGPKGSTSPK